MSWWIFACLQDVYSRNQASSTSKGPTAKVFHISAALVCSIALWSLRIQFTVQKCCTAGGLLHICTQMSSVLLINYCEILFCCNDQYERERSTGTCVFSCKMLYSSISFPHWLIDWSVVRQYKLGEHRLRTVVISSRQHGYRLYKIHSSFHGRIGIVWKLSDRVHICFTVAEELIWLMQLGMDFICYVNIWWLCGLPIIWI